MVSRRDYFFLYGFEKLYKKWLTIDKFTDSEDEVIEESDEYGEYHINRQENK